MAIIADKMLSMVLSVFVGVFFFGYVFSLQVDDVCLTLLHEGRYYNG